MFFYPSGVFGDNEKKTRVKDPSFKAHDLWGLDKNTAGAATKPAGKKDDDVKPADKAEDDKPADTDPAEVISPEFEIEDNDEGKLKSVKIGEETYNEEQFVKYVNELPDDAKVEYFGDTLSKPELLKKLGGDDPKPADTDTKGKKDTDQEYKLNDKITLNEKEYNALVEGCVKEFDLTQEEINEMPEARLNKYLLNFYNIEQGKKSLNKKHQETAREKRDLEGEKSKLKDMRAEIEREEKKKKAEAELLEERKKALNEKEKELKALVKRDLEAEYDDGAINETDKKKLEYKQMRAEELLVDIEQERKDIKDEELESAKEMQKVQAKSTAVYLKFVVTDILEATGIKTSKPVEDILDEASKIKDLDALKEWKKANAEDHRNAKLVSRIMNDYLQWMSMNKDSKLTPGQFYELNIEDYPEAAQPDSKGGQKNNKKETVKELAVKNAFKRALEKQKQTPPNPGGHSTDSTVSYRNGKGPEKNKVRQAISKNYAQE